MSFHVYILYSPSTDRIYRGQAQDLHERLRRHNAGMEPSTKAGKPWTLLWRTSKNSRSDAYKLEAKLKNLSRQRTLRFMLNYDDGIPNETSGKMIRQLIETG